MLNQIVLVGRIVNEPTDGGIKESKITLAVTRSYKNEEGIYETDLFPIILWEALVTNIIDYCHKGDVIGVKGRLQIKEDKLEVIAEKITFLSSARKDKKEGEE